MKTYQVWRCLLSRSGGGCGLGLCGFGRHFDEWVGLYNKNSGEFCDDEDGLETDVLMTRDAIEQLLTALWIRKETKGKEGGREGWAGKKGMFIYECGVEVVGWADLGHSQRGTPHIFRGKTANLIGLWPVPSAWILHPRTKSLTLLAVSRRRRWAGKTACQRALKTAGSLPTIRSAQLLQLGWGGISAASRDEVAAFRSVNLPSCSLSSQPLKMPFRTSDNNRSLHISFHTHAIIL